MIVDETAKPSRLDSVTTSLRALSLKGSTRIQRVRLSPGDASERDRGQEDKGQSEDEGEAHSESTNRELFHISCTVPSPGVKKEHRRLGIDSQGRARPFRPNYHYASR